VTPTACVSNEKQCVRARFIANGCGEFEACCVLDDDEQGKFQLRDNFVGSK
jgi:hypothetical protein